MSKDTLSPIVVKAIDFAVKHHKEQTRKGTGRPYLAHLFNVSGILADAGCDDEVVAAGLLHDVVEDTGVEIEELRMQFSSRIAGIVEACTENYKLIKTAFDGIATWQERKEHTVKEVIPHATAEQLQVILADKLDNIRSIHADYKTLGDELWTRFNAGKDRQKWYFQSVIEAARNNKNIDEKGKTLRDKIRQVHDDLFNDLSENEIVKISIANDHSLLRMGIKITLERIKNFKVVQETSFFPETIEKINQEDIDILLLDDVMPGGEILSSLEIIATSRPALKIIITTMHTGDGIHFKKMGQWARGLLSYNVGAENYIKAIETVYLGGLYYYVPGYGKKSE
jgi:CheY-like chemotaxis protein